MEACDAVQVHVGLVALTTEITHAAFFCDDGKQVTCVTFLRYSSARILTGPQPIQPYSEGRKRIVVDILCAERKYKPCLR